METSEFENMKTQCYNLRGWDIVTGIPTRETLEQTGLEDIAQNLGKKGKLSEELSDNIVETEGGRTTW